MQTEDRDGNSGSRNKLDANLTPYKTTYKDELLKLPVGPLSPLRLLVTIIGGIFMAEVVAMVVVYALSPLPYIQLTLIDAGIMTILVFPVLYFLSFQPLLRYIEKSRQAEEKNRMLSSIVVQTADTVVVTDREGLIEYVNPALEQLTGFTKGEVLGKTPRVLKSGLHSQPFYKNLWDTILNGEVYQNEIANLKKNGDLFYEVKTITPLRDESGDITHFVATGKDITERREAEEQLRKAYDNLELRVQARTEELRIANSELEEEITERKRVEGKLQAQAVELEMQAEELQAQQMKLGASEERARNLIQFAPAAIYEIDFYGNRFISVNDIACQWSGYTREELLSMNPLTLTDEESRLRFQERVEKKLSGESVAESVEYKIFTKDGREIIVAANVGAMTYEDGRPKSALVVAHNITERKHMEESLRQLNRTLKALSESNQAMMRATSEAEYLDQVCNIIVKDCGHAMVWIGYAEEDEYKSVRPVASAGFEAGYLETLKITWADSERGRGPTGTAIRTGRPSRCRNMLTDPQFEPWRAEALKRGYASSIVLPLITTEKVLGAITIYSSEPDSFSDDEEKLLSELAGDLVYGVTAIRMREAHARTSEALRLSEERFRLALKNAPVTVAVQDKDLRYIWAYNQRTMQFADVINKTDTDLFPPEFAARLIALKHQVLETGTEIKEQMWVNSGGRQVYLDIYLEPVFNEAGQITGVGVATVDLTERVQAEEALRAANEELKRFNNLMVGRELRMIELKKEVNGLCASANQPLRYPLDFVEESTPSG